MIATKLGKILRRKDLPEWIEIQRLGDRGWVNVVYIGKDKIGDFLRNQPAHIGWEIYEAIRELLDGPVK